MKKTAIALAISGLALASVAQAAPQANTFYVGAKAGWASFHHGLNKFDSKHNNGEGYGIHRNSVTYGVFGGYQIIDNLAVELGYDYFGRMKGNQNLIPTDKALQAFKHTAHGTTLSLKGSYPIIDSLDGFIRVGAALIRNDYKIRDVNPTQKEYDKAHTLKTSLLLGGGLEYAILPELALRAEYQWLSRAGNLDKAYAYKANTHYSPDIGSVSLGLSYRFGQGAAPVAAPEVITKNFSFNSDVLFDFGKASLRPNAAAAIDGAHAEISALGLAAPAIQVAGYTDRIGSEKFNQKLSQKRAETVANYIVSKGVEPSTVSAVGYGKANPVTGNTCDAVKGRKQLIACLAPDRRVEISVQGSKQVTM